jgi:hypothetical protein
MTAGLVVGKLMLIAVTSAVPGVASGNDTIRAGGGERDLVAVRTCEKIIRAK